MPNMAPSAEEERPKIVAHAKDGRLFKGFLQDGGVDVPQTNGGVPRPAQLPPHLSIRALDGRTHNVALTELKAVFFVKSFDGSKQYTETKFFNAHPVLEGIWARLHFNDNETIEGVIYNSLHFITSEGFFLKPPDPHSNNRMMYVLKSSLRDFRIMGVRNTY
jgi:hypothetical protein